VLQSNIALFLFMQF